MAGSFYHTGKFNINGATSGKVEGEMIKPRDFSILNTNVYRLIGFRVKNVKDEIVKLLER